MENKEPETGKEKAAATGPTAGADAGEGHAAKPLETPIVNIVIEVDLSKSGVEIRHNAPTIVLNGVLRRASLMTPTSVAVDEKAPTKRKVTIHYDIQKELMGVVTNADEVVHLGMIETAILMISQNQSLQRWDKAQAARENLAASAPKRPLFRPGRVKVPGGRPT